MRQGQQNRRGRGRNRKGQNPLSRSYESNGPSVKIRGTAAHIAEKYMSLARDAQSSGDTIMAENYLQHAEHYNRIIMAAQAQFQQPMEGGMNGGGMGHRPRHQPIEFGQDDDAEGDYDDQPAFMGHAPSFLQPVGAPGVPQPRDPFAGPQERQGYGQGREGGQARYGRHEGHGGQGPQPGGHDYGRQPQPGHMMDEQPPFGGLPPADGDMSPPAPEAPRQGRHGGHEGRFRRDRGGAGAGEEGAGFRPQRRRRHGNGGQHGQRQEGAPRGEAHGEMPPAPRKSDIDDPQPT